MTNSYEAFQIFNSYRNHFLYPSYNIIKYHGKIKTSLEKFSLRNDILYFEKLSKIPDLKNFILANILQNPQLYIKDLISNEESNKIYLKWKKINSSLEYFCLEDCKKLKPNFIDNIKIEHNKKLPYMLELLKQGKINPETICIFYRIIKNLEDIWTKECQSLEWIHDLKFKLYKYNQVFTISKDDEIKIKNKVLDFFAKV